MRPRLILAGLVAGLLTATAVSTGPSAATEPAFGHVFIIVGENKSLSQITSYAAPYIMKTLKPTGAWFTGYNHVTEGSLADYIALTSGQYAPCQTHGPCGSFNVPSIFSQLGNGNWRDWNESMPDNCHRGHAGDSTSFNGYKPGHNPALYYSGLPCSTYDVPAGTTGPNNMSKFNNALAAGTVPKYNFVSPNLCEDGYHRCDSFVVQQFDNFLKKEIPLIKASPSFGSNGLIVVTFDEGSLKLGDPNTMMLVLGPQVQRGTYTGYYDHYSTLKTIQKGLGLPCLAHSCQASSFPIFGP